MRKLSLVSCLLIQILLFVVPPSGGSLYRSVEVGRNYKLPPEGGTTNIYQSAHEHQSIRSRTSINTLTNINQYAHEHQSIRSHLSICSQRLNRIQLGCLPRRINSKEQADACRHAQRHKRPKNRQRRWK